MCVCVCPAYYWLTHTVSNTFSRIKCFNMYGVLLSTRHTMDLGPRFDLWHPFRVGSGLLPYTITRVLNVQHSLQSKMVGNMIRIRCHTTLAHYAFDVFCLSYVHRHTRVNTSLCIQNIFFGFSAEHSVSTTK